MKEMGRVAWMLLLPLLITLSNAGTSSSLSAFVDTTPTPGTQDYYGQAFPVCPFCNTTMCEYLRKNCSPLNSTVISTCQAFVKTHCDRFGTSEPGCECCTSSTCFPTNGRCGMGVNNWFCTKTGVSCDSIPDPCDAQDYTGTTSNQAFFFEYRFINNWTPRTNANIDEIEIYSPNLTPSYWQADSMVAIQGAMNVGTEKGVAVLPTAFRPTRNVAFISTTAPDDTRNATLPVLVRVLTSGIILVDSNLAKISSAQLTGMYSLLPDSNWTSIASSLASGVVFNSSSPPQYFEDFTNGHIVYRGTVQQNCISGECLLATGVPIPSQMSRDFIVPQGLSSNGEARYLRITTGREMYLLGRSSNTNFDVFLDGIVLLQEDVSSFSNFTVSRGQVVTSQHLNSSSSVIAEMSGLSLVQIQGLIIPANYSFHNMVVANVFGTFRPKFVYKQLVPCQISPRVLNCAVKIGLDGNVRVLSPLNTRFNKFAPSSTDHWISLDNVRWSGFVLLVQLTLQGAAVMNIEGESSLTV